MSIDYPQRPLIVVGWPVRLPVIQPNLLAALVVNAEQVVTHQDLLRGVWGQVSRAPSCNPHPHVMRMRQKLGRKAKTPPTSSPSRGGYWMAGQTTGYL